MHAPVTITLCVLAALVNAGPIVQRQRNPNLGAFTPGLVVGDGAIGGRSPNPIENGAPAGSIAERQRNPNLGAFTPGLVVGDGAIGERSPNPIENGAPAGSIVERQRDPNLGAFTPGLVVGDGSIEGRSPSPVEEDGLPAGPFGDATTGSSKMQQNQSDEGGFDGEVAFRQVGDEEVEAQSEQEETQYSGGPYEERRRGD